MDIQEAVVIGAKLGIPASTLVNVDDLAGHLLDGLRSEFALPGVSQHDVNARMLVALLDMHARLKDLEDMWQRE